MCLIFREGDRNRVQNYHLIFNLTSFSKTLERIISVRFLNYPEDNGSLSVNMCGFRRNRSIDLAVNKWTDNTASIFYNDKKFLTIFIDLVKAFFWLDLYFHAVGQTQKIGFREIQLKLLESYLVGRLQYDCSMILLWIEWTRGLTRQHTQSYAVSDVYKWTLCPILRRKDAIKYLGVTIDRNLNFKEHIRVVCARVRKLYL